MKDDTGEQFVAYFVPTDETLTRRQLRQAVKESKKAADGDQPSTSAAAAGDGTSASAPTETSAATDDDTLPEDYTLLRNYNWNVKTKDSHGFDQAYFVVFRNGQAYYNELETRVKLFRRRVAGMYAILRRVTCKK